MWLFYLAWLHLLNLKVVSKTTFLHFASKGNEKMYYRVNNMLKRISLVLN